MASRTLAQLRTRAKERANMENSSFLATSEWNENINYAIAELRDIMISKVGDDYFATSQTYTLVSTTDTYALPADFYKVLWCEVLADDGYYYKMKRFERSEKNMGANPLVTIYSPDIRYRLLGSNLQVTPITRIGGRTIKLWYVPLPIELSSDSDTLDGMNGWDEYIVLRAAVMALEKEEQDTSALSVRLEQMRQRLESMTDNRDQSNPMRIYDNEKYSDGRWVWP